MTAEINWTIQGRLNTGRGDQIIAQGTFDQATPGAWRKIVTVTTGGVTIVPDVTTLGYAFLKNLDATNYIQVGGYPSSTLDSVIRLLPGQFAVVPLDPTLTLRAQAHTATCLLDISVWDA